MRWLRAAAGLAGVLAAAACAKPAPDHPALKRDPARPLIIAHKGGDGLMPANTMAAFRSALKAGADVLEFDVHASRDGVLVAIHDETLDGTTEATGPVKDKTFQELQALDAGYDWPRLREPHHPAGNPWRGQDLKIPAVQEILSTFPDARFAIEIKQNAPSVTARLCALLRENSAEKRSIVGSFDQKTIDDFRGHCPEVATAASQAEATRFFGLNAVFMAELNRSPALALQIPENSKGLTVVTPRLMQAAKAANVDVHVWTINDADEIARFVKMGVDGIITDYPDRILEILSTTPEVSTLAAPKTN